ncbi:extracellular solute-binding protein [Dongia rigui]|uniref:Extracellular solute-binding protein n=1 Tax=Dongia rigui TaxID=940149 RepID=A0ABU5E093_9PROT|nr:extracellular solute-binding protein [Dongia rigui]MDY0873006.1 extracellular solute-binding protein [Dongia rigui]
MTKKILTPAQETMRAALVSRRTLMRSAAAVGAVGLSSPMLVKNAFSSSGELNLLMWSDEFPDPVIPGFEKATGIKVNQTPFSQNEEQINKLQATGGEGFDLCQPTCNRAPQYKDLAVLAPFDTNKIKNMSAFVPSMLESSQKLWTWEDGLYHLPHCWGSEALSYRTDLYKGDLANLSYGSLWADDVKGHTQGRGHSFLLGIGLWWDASGKQPSNRMLDGYKDEASFKKVWDPILAFAIEHKSWVKQFWDSADNTKSGLMENDVWIGQTWDGPPLSLKKEGKPVNYTSPKEGAIVWLDGLSQMKAAKNTDQIYEFINYLTTPEVSAQVAEGSGYNPVITGGDALTSDVFKKNFQEAYPGDALKNVWPWPAEPAWYAEIRSQYVDQFKAA